MIDASSTKPADKNAVLIIACIAAFVTCFMASAILVALPTISNELSIDAVLLSWIVTSYLLSSAIFLIPLGRIADIYGRKKVLTIGVIIYTAASCLAAISSSITGLLLARILQGAGGAMMFGTTAALITSVYLPGERGKAMGIFLAFSYIGMSIGPLLGGIIIQYLGWRSVFWFGVFLGLALIVIIMWKVKGEWAEAKGEKLDIVGSVIYGVALISIIYGFSALPDWTGLSAFIIGSAIMFIFIVWEIRNKSPILDIRQFKNNRVFAFSNLATFISFCSLFAVGFLMSLYLQYIKGLMPRDAGLTIMAMPAVQAIFSPLSGRLSDKIDPQLLASVGMGVITCGLLLFIFIGDETPLWFIVMCLMLLGLGFALFASPNTNTVMSSVNKMALGVASATQATMRITGQIFSLTITTLLISLVIGHVQITAQYHPQFIMCLKIALTIFTVISFGGIFACLVRSRPRVASS